MVKTENSTGQNNTSVHGSVQAAACAECIFWYRCRGGKLDCLFRTPLAMADSIRA